MRRVNKASRRVKTKGGGARDPLGEKAVGDFNWENKAPRRARRGKGVVARRKKKNKKRD